jgi:hypothetical protein
MKVLLPFKIYAHYFINRVASNPAYPAHLVIFSNILLCFKKLYTERVSKIGFGLMRKLSRFNDRKSSNIRNMMTCDR